MSITLYIEPISNGKELLIQLLHEEFGISNSITERLYISNIEPHFDKFKSNTFILAETEYVDKVYRDSYYHYYSSKLQNYKRNTIRLSFFEGQIEEMDFRNKDKHAKLQSQYRGFIVIRPTIPFIIGRSIITPLLLKNNDFSVCLSKFHTTANGVKFSIYGFPHSSQDTETMSCAETTLWAIMEYFSNKYSNYQPVLPSKIISTLNQRSYERQIPSKGLNITQIAYALREFGFGVKIYSKEEYSKEFERLLSCYIESGIPLVVAVQGESIGHALIVIGHDKIKKSAVDSISSIYSNSENGIEICDYDSINREFIFIDDNQPAYQKAPLLNPTSHYNDDDWSSCSITYFIAPLYPKIHLEAFEAKNYVLKFLINGPVPLVDKSKILLRFYLSSSRSFKDALAKNETFQDDLKQIILEASMPKFIWVAEVSSRVLIKDNKANGIILLDATEANIYYNKPLVLAAYQNNLILFDEDKSLLENNVLNLSEFRNFDHNLYTMQQ